MSSPENRYFMAYTEVALCGLRGEKTYPCNFSVDRVPLKGKMSLVYLGMMIYVSAMVSCANITIMSLLKTGSSLLAVGASYCSSNFYKIITVPWREQ